MTAAEPHELGKSNFRLLAIAIVVAAVIVSASILLVFLAPYVGITNTQSWEVVKPNVTVYGFAAGIPCGALRTSCITTKNQSIPATLIRYDGTYYYVSYFGVNTTWYTVWYNNSTEYCVSPKVQWDIACP